VRILVYIKQLIIQYTRFERKSPQSYFSFPSRFKWDLGSSGMLYGVDW